MNYTYIQILGDLCRETFGNSFSIKVSAREENIIKMKLIMPDGIVFSGAALITEFSLLKEIIADRAIRKYFSQINLSADVTPAESRVMVGGIEASQVIDNITSEAS